MAKKKIKEYTFGSFLGDGLGFGLAGGFDEEKVEKMRLVLNEAESKIRTVYRNEIKRLEKFVAETFLVVPSEDDFISWFDRNRMYKNWEELPKITDKEIFEAANEYFEQCRNAAKKVKSSSKKKVTLTQPLIIVQELAKYDLKKLVFFFSDEIFSANTTEADIRGVFSYPLIQPTSCLKLKVNNKEFVLLLLEMQDKNILVPDNLFGIIGNLECFKSKSGTLLERNDLDQAKSKLKSKPLAPDNETSLKELVKKIKIQ